MVRPASEGIQDLIDRTAGPPIQSRVTVDQIYAQDQHETMYYRHPRGGGPKYLEGPLFAQHPKWIQEFANGLLREGSDAERGWGGVGRSLVNQLPKSAPVEFGDLRQSGSLTVRAGSRVVISEPAKQKRLSEAELDAKDYMRSLGLRYR